MICRIKEISVEFKEKNVLYVLIFFLLVALGFDFCVYFFLYISGVFGFYLIARAFVRGEYAVSVYSFTPLILFFFILVTPGSLFKDVHVAGIASSAFFAGAAVYCFLKDKIDQLFFVFPVALSLNFVFCGLQSLLLSSPFLGTSGADGRLALSFSGPFILAELATLCIFMLLCFPHTVRTFRIFGYSLIPVLSLMILLSGSRSAFLGIASVIFFVSIAQSWRKAMVAIVVILLTVVVLFPVLSTTSQSRLFGMLTAPTKEATFQSRVPLWSFAYKSILDAPIIGNGMRNFQKNYGQFLDHNISELQEKNPYVEARSFKHPHNVYIQVLYGWGVVGFILLAITLVGAWRYSDGNLRIFISYTYAFFLGSGMFETRMLSKDGAMFLFFPVGMAFVMSLRESGSSSSIS